jgi:replication factor C large subunit
MLWTVKHAPKKVEEVAGNESAKEEVKTWALEWGRGKAQKPLLLFGPTGVGKTALGVALAREMEWNLVETNAGDLRDAENLKKIIGLSSSSTGLFGERRLILIDEIDSAFDRGEIPELLRILKDARQPIIVIANDVWNQKISSIKALCKQIELKGVNARSVQKVLEKIAAVEGKKCGFAAEIASGCKGDLRSAINDLQASCAGEGGAFSVSGRDREASIFEVLKTVFKTTDFVEAARAADDLDEDIETVQKWLEENISAEYEKAEEVAEAFNWISKSDVFNGRVKKRQYYKLLLYVRALALAGVALSKKETYRKFTPYHYPSIIRLLGTAKKNRGLLASAAKKAGGATHCSARKAKAGLLPFLGSTKNAEEYFGFNEEETELLKEVWGKQ